MAKLSKKEFAAKCDIPTNSLSVYIKRGKVILNADDEIDDTDPRNDTFLKKQLVKASHKSVTEVEIKEPVITKNTAKSEVESNNEVAKLDLQKTSIQVEKLQQEVRLLKIKAEKLNGIVVPTELVVPIFLQHNQSIITEVHNESVEFVRQFVKLHNVSLEDEAVLKGNLIKWYNNAIARATEASKVSIKNIVKEYAKNRGVGERD